MIPFTRTIIPASSWRAIASEFGTPTYVYDEASLRNAANLVKSFPHGFGFTPRFAIKATPTQAILQLFNSMGIHFDASSGYEAQRAVNAGIPHSHISLSSQQIPYTPDLLALGVKYNACSLKQVKWFGERFEGKEIGLRFNPGQGSGETVKTNVGGQKSAFGIWYEQIDEVKQLVEQYKLKVVRIHTHIGSGTDAAFWCNCATLSLQIVTQFPDVTVLNMGGGFKVNRATYHTTDILSIGASLREVFVKYANDTNRQLHLEIEPGTFLTALSGYILATVEDSISNGVDGPHFLKADTGMTEIIRPTMYDAVHNFEVIPQHESNDESNNNSTGSTKLYSIAGHCCESGDLLSLRDSDDELIPLKLNRDAEIGDLLVIGGAGAYCSGMSAKNYNSFPEAAEVLISPSLQPHLIRSRQTLEQITANEVPFTNYFAN